MAEYASSSSPPPSSGPTAPAPSGPSPSAPEPSAPPSSPPGWQPPPGVEAAPVDHLSDYRSYFAANPGLEDALRAGLGGSQPLDDAGLVEALQETNAFFLQNVRHDEQQHFHTRQYTNDPVFAQVANRLARTMTLLQKDNQALRARLQEYEQSETVYEGRRGTRAEGEQYSENALDDELDRVRETYLNDKLPPDRRQSAFRRLEKLQRMKFER